MGVEIGGGPWAGREKKLPPEHGVKKPRINTDETRMVGNPCLSVFHPWLLPVRYCEHWQISFCTLPWFKTWVARLPPRRLSQLLPALPASHSPRGKICRLARFSRLGEVCRPITEGERGAFRPCVPPRPCSTVAEVARLQAVREDLSSGEFSYRVPSRCLRTPGIVPCWLVACSPVPLYR